MKTISLFDSFVENEVNSVKVVEIKDDQGNLVSVDFQKKSWLEATHDAIDEYRRYSKRQIQGETFDIMSETILGDEESIDVLDFIEVSQIFSQLLVMVQSHPQCPRQVDKDRAVKLVCCLFRLNNLETLLDDIQGQVMKAVLGEFQPDTEMEIAEFMGYAVRKDTGSCQMLTQWKHWLAKAATENGIRMAI